MALTILHPKTALVVIDLQKGFAASPTAHPVPAVISQARLLADGFSVCRLHRGNSPGAA